jgi:hypothetical protein
MNLEATIIDLHLDDCKSRHRARSDSSRSAGDAARFAGQVHSRHGSSQYSQAQQVNVEDKYAYTQWNR